MSEKEVLFIRTDIKVGKGQMTFLPGTEAEAESAYRKTLATKKEAGISDEAPDWRSLPAMMSGLMGFIF